MMFNIVTSKDIEAEVLLIMDGGLKMLMVEAATGLNKENILIQAVQNAYAKKLTSLKFSKEQIEATFDLIYSYAITELTISCAKCKKLANCPPAVKMQSMGFTDFACCETFYRGVMERMGGEDASNVN